jgi:hypothetical protein
MCVSTGGRDHSLKITVNQATGARCATVMLLDSAGLGQGRYHYRYAAPNIALEPTAPMAVRGASPSSLARRLRAGVGR